MCRYIIFFAPEWEEMSRRAFEKWHPPAETFLEDEGLDEKAIAML